MSAQQVILIVGIVALVAAVVLAALAAWTYRALDIRGVRADLSGKARAREVSEASAASSRAARASSARAFSDATWGGAVSKKGVAPTERVPRPVGSPPRVARPSPPPPDADAATSLLDGDEPTTVGDAAAEEPTTLVEESFEFRVTRRELGAASPQRIEG